MIRIDRINMSLDSDEGDVYEKTVNMLGKRPEKFYIYKKAVDARRKSDVHFVYSIAVSSDNEEKRAERIKDAYVFDDSLYCYPKLKNELSNRPVIVGSGPAGTFAALLLAHAGARPIILERGKKVDERKKDVDGFFSGGELDENSNVQFGEGGAGTFSDGKLNTGTGSAYLRKILSEYVRFGAPERIMWEAKPHIGTDILLTVAKNIRKEVESLGGEYRFSDGLCDIEIENGQIKAVLAKEKIETDDVILALGHSARDTFKMLKSRGVTLCQKPFSVGVRIEHLQEKIDKIQYGRFAGHKNLPAADYKFGGDCYSFCMCPGGFVVASQSERQSIVTNGMSFSDRGGTNANSAILVNVDGHDFGDGVFDGMDFQERIEREAYLLTGSYAAPCQKLSDFAANAKTTSFGSVLPTYRPGTAKENIRSILPERISENILSGLTDVNKKMGGFFDPDALLTAPETRSSSPVRILRNKESLESVSVGGLYPCGEGAGYAGGIMSAAADGIRCAERIVLKYNNEV